MLSQKISLKDYTTFRMGGEALVYFASSKKDVESFFELHADGFILGGGSNILVSEKRGETPFLKIASNAFTVQTDEEGEKNEDDTVQVRVEAGLSWDKFVRKTVEMNLSGLEALSYIPGTVGASLVQNVGAYGAEVKDTLVSATMYDTQEKVWKVFSNKECEFSYRKSIFQKHKEYVIYDTLWKLSKKTPRVPSYPSLVKYMEERGLKVTLENIRDAVIAVRRSKLPEIMEVASVGSFFKNPIVSKEKSEELKKVWENLPLFKWNETENKVAAGFLIEQSCSEIFEYKNLALYDKNRLVMIHKGGATLAEVDEYILLIQEKVREKFGVELEREPEIVA